ncbi:MAG: VCBS repeat-containing protein [Salinivirgaceae bacterium]|nr:VCBS repeat-containing protein [Salinivirgaceae bacterium]
MKRIFLFNKYGKRWNKFLRQFKNLYQRIKNGSDSEYQKIRLINKLNQIYVRLEKMQHKVGVKLAGTAIAIMMLSATSFAQDFSAAGTLKASVDIDLNYTYDAAFADIDNDGDLDLYAAHHDDGLLIFTNDGNGNFSETESLNISKGESFEFVDIDGDNDLDLIRGNGGTIDVFTNEGNGVFIDSGKLQAGGADIDINTNKALIFADIDGDSDLDLYISERYAEIKVFTNNGSGIFTDAGNLQADGADIEASYLEAVFADVDGDSDLDLCLSRESSVVKVFTNDGAGNLTDAGNLQANGADVITGGYVHTVFADIDGDSDLDLFIRSAYSYFKALINDGSGNFTDAGNLQANGADIDVRSHEAPIFADIDGDNDLDLYITNPSDVIKVFTNDGNGNFSEAGNLQSSSTIKIMGTSFPEFADIDGDSDLDLFFGNEVFTNEGNGVFAAGANLQADGSDINMGDAVFADIDGDSDLDLYVGKYDGNIGVYINDGSGVFSTSGLLQVDGADFSVYGRPSPVFADIDGDSDLDLYVGETYGTIMVFINDGNGNFSASGNLQADGADINVPSPVPVFADIDGDNDLDLYIGETFGTIKVFVNDGGGNFSADGNFQAEGSDIVIGHNSAPAFADIDGDSDLDLYVGEYNGTISIFINNVENNTAPVADAGAAQSVYENELVTLDGSGSNDADSDALSYLWTAPDGITLSDATVISPAFTAPEVTEATNYIFTLVVNDGTDNSVADEVVITVENAVGIDNFSDNQFSVYPNPSTGILTLNLNIEDQNFTNSKILITDISGKTIQQLNVSNKQLKIDLSAQINGIYFVKFINNEGVKIAKVVKK